MNSAAILAATQSPGLAAGSALVELVFGVVLQVLVIWGASKLVTPKTGTFTNAVRQFVFILVLGLVMVIVAVIITLVLVGIMHGSHPQHGGSFLAVMGGAFLLFVAIYIIGWFAITMKIYNIGAWKAFGFLLVLIVVGSIVRLCEIPITNALLPEDVRKEREARVKQFIEVLKAAIEHKPIPASSSWQAGATPGALPLPKQVKIVSAVQIPAVVDGRTAGEMTLKPGTMVKLLSTTGSKVKIQYMETVANIPRSATDLPEDAGQ